MFPMGKHILPMSRQQIYANLHPILLEDPQGRLHFHSSRCCWQFQRSGVGHPSLPRPWFFHRSEDWETRPHSVISLRLPLEAVSLWPGSTMFNPGEKAEKTGKHRQTMLTGPKSTGTANICKHSLQQIVISTHVERGKCHLDFEVCFHTCAEHINTILRPATTSVILNRIAAKHGIRLLRNSKTSRLLKIV